MSAVLPAAIAAQQAQLQANVAMSALKASAQADQQIASLLQASIENVPVSPVRGSNVNTSA